MEKSRLPTQGGEWGEEHAAFEPLDLPGLHRGKKGFDFSTEESRKEDQVRTEEVERELAPHRDRRIVVHCHLGGRSLQVAQWLRSQGFGRAQSMAGGIDTWACDIDKTLRRY